MLLDSLLTFSMRTCANLYVGLSLAAVLVLPVWAALLFSKSMALELPDAKKISAGRACVLTTIFYALSGIAAALYLHRQASKYPG